MPTQLDVKITEHALYAPFDSLKVDEQALKHAAQAALDGVLYKAFGRGFRKLDQEYSFLGVGSFRIALLHNSSKIVYKFYHAQLSLQTDSSIINLLQKTTLIEAENLNNINFQNLHKLYSRYAATGYYTVGELDVVVQEYLPKKCSKLSESRFQAISESDVRLWDVRERNMAVDDGGKVVLFDCIAHTPR